MKGGYQPRSRLETTLDEIAMEAASHLVHERDEHLRQVFGEIARLARKGATLLDLLIPPTGGLAAGAPA